MKTYLLATTAAVLMAGPLMAGGLVQPTVEPVIATPAPVVAPVYDWSGAYVGATGGWQFGSSTLDPGATVDVDGAASYGAFAGYNFQNGNMVYGGELAAGLYNGFPVGSPTASYDYVIDAKARAGIAMDNVLLYGFAGPSLASFTDAGANQYNLLGANFGVGGEYGVTDNLSVGLEYIGHYLTGDTAAPATTQTDWLHGVQARVALRF
ncbi:MAG: outer membrane beta-barrel protein [Maritimibacter sp.]|nr:outer membrane beta-barrel protein [Maritimibacter sp.]